jgi:hypothetical protein
MLLVRTLLEVPLAWADVVKHLVFYVNSKTCHISSSQIGLNASVSKI